ncbi:phosphotransferase family protein [Nocardioides panzhihuensis]|uniref:Aminoglycoside phosphotransferase (APT) family kinase protein n=1 Tax=Nocardioides panzhihuensis TaxID=860243 RepID=A0A7Z0IQ68_9ACTN|nr:phosphotransferase family protein [Nocardioides panzhihuensis]NYI75516.1 aminoglycoside phosphotransferase (APT) family kinase protein [Nocardioides panzhihuensis]
MSAVTSPVEGVDLAAVARWMDGAGIGSGPIADIVAISGGTQNVMVRFTRDGAGYVLRRGPLRLRPASNKVITRETRALRAMAGTDVPHPRLIAACEDPGVLGDAVFYLMEPIDGFCAGQGLPELHANGAGVRHQMGLELARAAATLAAVDHVAVGLADYGRPDSFLERQVPRWRSELASFDALDGYPGPAIGDVDGVAGWLDEYRPVTWTPGILHGDLHASNVMFSRAGPEVVAVVDWEMSTIGDPLLDLGWLLATWDLGDASRDFGGCLMEAGDIATHQELIAAYAETAKGGRADRDLSRIDWYIVLACFKAGIILEGTHARACAGLAPVETGDRLHHAAVRLFERAQHIINA